MLVDPVFIGLSGTFKGAILAAFSKNTPTIRLDQGVYECVHSNFDLEIDNIKDAYPLLKSNNRTRVCCYGVCDNVDQVISLSDELCGGERRFVISLVPKIKAQEPSQGGWRWHKWGPYIGTHTPCAEYLYEEPVIEKVYCYHIYELI